MGEKEREWRKKNEYKTKFSVIVPMKNCEGFIENALNSIKRQEYENCEIFVIDDHSDDGSVKKVRNYIENNKNMNIELLKVEDGRWGAGAGRNVGLDKATGDYIIFLDSDDEIKEKSFNMLNQSIKQNDMLDVFLLGHTMYTLDYKGNLKRKTDFNPGKFQSTKLFQMGINPGGTIWQGCWKRSLFEDNNIRFDENCIFEDTTARIQLYGKANKIKIAGINTHKYFVRPGKSICTTQTSKNLKASIEMARRISRLVKEGKVDKKYKKYIYSRLLTTPASLAWILYCMGQYKIYQYKTHVKENFEENNKLDR